MTFRRIKMIAMSIFVLYFFSGGGATMHDGVERILLPSETSQKKVASNVVDMSAIDSPNLSRGDILTSGIKTTFHKAISAIFDALSPDQQEKVRQNFKKQ